MWIADIIAGFLIALLSGMGVGSAGLLVVWLTAIGGVDQLAAQGLNLYFFLFSSSASLFVHLRRRKILWGVCLILTLFGVVGALAGAILATALDPTLLRRLFGGMLILSGIASLFGVIFGKKEENAVTGK